MKVINSKGFTKHPTNNTGKSATQVILCIKVPKKISAIDYFKCKQALERHFNVTIVESI